MNREDTLLLFSKGRDAWNEWARQAASEIRCGEAAQQAASADFSSDVPLQNANFSGFRFPGLARFGKVNFAGDADFEGAEFSSDAVFEGATFSSRAIFGRVVFQGDAEFTNATFSGDAVFGRGDTIFGRRRGRGARFLGDAVFGGAKFKIRAIFDEATFSGNVEFETTAFSTATFDETTFSRDAVFGGFGVAHGMRFREAPTFSSDAIFDEATFSGQVSFEGAAFPRRAGFGKAKFFGGVTFSEAKFTGNASFHHATFEGFATYADATFHGSADFSAIHSERAFSLANAKFAEVPDFIQSHFAEAPRLDNVHFSEGLSWRKGLWDRMTARRVIRPLGGESNSARYRALKRLAIQAYDHESEMKFFAAEIAGARFVTDYPVIWRLWSPTAWWGVLRFWSGWLYQLTSSFGRSLIRPLGLWLLTAVLGAAYFLGQNPDVIEARNAAIAAGASKGVLTYAGSSFTALQKRQPCFAGLPDKNQKGDPIMIGLPEPMRRSTNAATEAMHLALRNGLVFVDFGPEAAYRTFGCLFGAVERYANVPSNVSIASAVQKLVSGVLIFLFGLAVRNMMRMK
jgi:hypothetical protein